MAYHTRFTHLHPKVISRTATLVRAKPWAADDEAQEYMAREFVTDLAAVYGFDVPDVQIRATDSIAFITDGYFDPGTWKIVLPRFSVVTLLHEFRHAMQHADVAGATFWPDRMENEHDARAWSCSVFYRAAPRRFRRMAREGRLLYV